MDTLKECDDEIASLDKQIATLDSLAPATTHSLQRARNRDVRVLRERRRTVKSRRALLFSTEKSKLFMHVAQRELPPAVFAKVYRAFEAANA